eukprot:1264122-Heterocapsa_arctica.AAC.1
MKMRPVSMTRLPASSMQREETIPQNECILVGHFWVLGELVESFRSSCGAIPPNVTLLAAVGGRVAAVGGMMTAVVAGVAVEDDAGPGCTSGAGVAI